MDLIIIADSGYSSLSGTNPLKLKLDDHSASVQSVLNYIDHQGHIEPPIVGDGVMSWQAAPKLNGLFLHQYLKKDGIESAIINNFSLERDRMVQLAAGQPKAVAISTTFFPDKNTLARVVSEIKTIAPDLLIIAGGPLVYSSYLLKKISQERSYPLEGVEQDFLFLKPEEDPQVDLYVISQTGEHILCKIINELKNSRPVALPHNTASFNGREYRFGSEATEEFDPAGAYIDWECMPTSVFQSGVLPMQASLGCPFQCSFCNFIKDRQRIYVKPLEDLLREMKTVADLGVKYVWFVDDNFRLGRGDLSLFCERLVEMKLPLKWMSFIRANALANVEPNLLRQAGCVEVQIGVESANDQILKNMNKKTNARLNGQVIDGLLAAGINCSNYFIFGFPGETQETVNQTIRFINDRAKTATPGILNWSFYPFILAPLSPIFDPNARSIYGLEGYRNKWRHNTMDIHTAKLHILQAFMEIEGSYPIYRDDNLDILESLDTKTRRAFFNARYHVSKQEITGESTPQSTLSIFENALHL